MNQFTFWEGELPAPLIGVHLEKQSGITFNVSDSLKDCPRSFQQLAFDGMFCGPPATEPERVFRHGKDLERHRVGVQALTAAMVPDSRIWRYRNCGADAWIEKEVGGDGVRVRCNTCKDRFCSRCAKARASLIAHGLPQFLDIACAKFITLTLKHTDEPLREQIQNAIGSLARLRASVLWRRCVSGGAWFLELHKAQSDNRWHVHFHLLVNGSYVPKQELSDAWRLASKGSYIVDIREPKSRKGVVAYCASYASKAFGAELWADRDSLSECVGALRGLRLWATFGQWWGVRVVVQGPPSSDYRTICRLSDCLDAAAAGQEWARALMLRLKRDFYIIVPAADMLHHDSGDECEDGTIPPF